MRYAERAVEYAQRNVTLRHDEFDAREILAGSVFYSGVAAPAGNWERRVGTFARASSLYHALRAERPEKESLQRNVGITERYLASLYHDRGQERRALEHGTRARDVSETILSS